MRTSHRFLSLTLAVVALLTLGVGPAAAAKQEVGPKIKVTGKALPIPDEDTFATSEDPANGKTPPTITGEGFNGQKITVEPATGPRIVLFVSHACPHCQAEVPRIVELAEDGGLEGIELITVSTNTSEDYNNYPPSKWLKRESWPFKPVLLDDKRSRALIAYGGISFPYFVFVAADGTVAGRYSGELDPDDLREIAERLVAGESLFG
jgi:thiol-disulfide isomerase/thioredoxin